MHAYRKFFSGLLVFAVVLSFCGPLAGRESAAELLNSDNRGIDGTFVKDGSGVHDVGMLHLHTANWGIFGSYPSSMMPTAIFPSAEWPAGSGVEYLYIGGLWVGAVKSGIPSVSTAAYETEFFPTSDLVDSIYASYEGAPGGNRLPSPYADDDNDGLVDEDWLDGHDNDMDGMIDEDYAAISSQMFSSWFTDDQPFSIAHYPDHTPLNIMVRQESYQWEDERFDDFVGFKYTITNTGDEVLEDIYLGLFVDGDAGPRDRERYWADDAVGRWTGNVCTEIGPASVDLGYVYDVDGDGGRTTGYFGAMILGYRTDPTGISAPKSVGMTSFQVFRGIEPYENGGDPTNDFQRYELMSKGLYDRDASVPDDYRILISTGGFGELLPGESLVLYTGVVAGEGLDGMIANAGLAKALFDGYWFDLDKDPVTGTDRRETPVYGPATGVVIDPCRAELSDPVDIPCEGMLWVNGDCENEEGFQNLCGYSESDSLVFCTGVAGRETQIHWLIDMPDQSPCLLDIYPDFCPNLFNVEFFEAASGGGGRVGGVMPVALLGAGDFDVHMVDPSSVQLEGVNPVFRESCSYKDVSQPVEGKTGCECASEGPDGYTDMIFHFGNIEIAEALDVDCVPQPGEEVMLTMTGKLMDGTSFSFTDCMTYVGDHYKSDEIPDKPILRPALPNPFNPVTRISFYLPEKQYIKIEVFDVSGRLISTLARGVYPQGESVIEWNASGISSGIYFYRLNAGEFSETKKVVLMR